MDVAQQEINAGSHLRRRRPNRITASTKVIPNPKAKLLDQVREVLRLKHYAHGARRLQPRWPAAARCREATRLGTVLLSSAWLGIPFMSRWQINNGKNNPQQTNAPNSKGHHAI